MWSWIQYVRVMNMYHHALMRLSESSTLYSYILDVTWTRCWHMFSFTTTISHISTESTYFAPHPCVANCIELLELSNTIHLTVCCNKYA